MENPRRDVLRLSCALWRKGFRPLRRANQGAAPVPRRLFKKADEKFIGLGAAECPCCQYAARDRARRFAHKSDSGFKACVPRGTPYLFYSARLAGQKPINRQNIWVRIVQSDSIRNKKNADGVHPSATRQSISVLSMPAASCSHSRLSGSQLCQTDHQRHGGDRQKGRERHQVDRKLHVLPKLGGKHGRSGRNRRIFRG